MENLEGVEKALKRKDGNKAMELVTEGKNLIEKRIKLIKLADREDWAAVKENVQRRFGI